MLWKILSIILVLEALGMITSFTLGGAIHIFLFLILVAIFIRLSQWLLSALTDLDHLLKLSL